MYYSPWLIIDAASKASGIAFNGKSKDGELKWDRVVVSIYVWAIETGFTPIKMMAYWNHTCHLWLKHYVQNRLVDDKGKVLTYATFLTFMVSAFWHGFYPFYYFMFFMCGCFVEVAKEIYRSRILFTWVPYPRFVCHILTMIILNYLGTSFA